MATLVLWTPNYIAQKRKKTYDEALREFDKLVISEDEILRAAGECGIEMNRNIVEVDRSELSKKLREVQISPWRKQIDMAYRKAHDESSVNMLFRTSYIKYSKESDDLFRECVLEYSIDESHIQTPVDQALAAIVMQIVALNFLTVVRENIQCMIVAISGRRHQFQLDTECFLDYWRKMTK